MIHVAVIRSKAPRNSRIRQKTAYRTVAKVSFASSTIPAKLRQRNGALQTAKHRFAVLQPRRSSRNQSYEADSGRPGILSIQDLVEPRVCAVQLGEATTSGNLRHALLLVSLHFD